MPSSLNLHIVLQPPYPVLFDEVEQLLWERNGKLGPARRYKVEAVRFGLQLAHKYLTQEKKREAAAAQIPLGSTDA